jgi:hypothetical protein
VGDEADAAGAAEELLVIVGQVPDAFPAMPPPSKPVIDVGVPAFEIPVPNDIPVREPVLDDVSAVDDVLTPPDDVPMAELARPNDDSAIAPPMPAHAELIPGAPTGDTPDVNGLTPGALISVAPRGIRTGGTGEAGPMPSGDVMPSGDGPGKTCAKTGPQPMSSAAAVAITKRVIGVDLIPHWNSPCAARTAR